MAAVPSVVDDGAGERLRVQRAWPKSGGRLTFEAVDPQHRIRAGAIGADGAVTVAPFAVDSSLPGLREWAGTAESSDALLVHRYRRRAVLRVQTAGPEPRFVKLFASGRSEAVAAASSLMHAVSSRAGFRAPAVLSSSPDRVVFSAVPGVGLHDLGAGGATTEWAAAWRSWAQRWPDLVRTPVDSAALAVHDGTAEAATLNRWVDHLLAFGAPDADPAAVRALAARIGEQLVDGLGETPLGLSHRDLHDKQLMYSADSDTPGLLDFDTAALAEPALDIANLAVHLELRRDQGLLDDAAARVAESAIGDVVRELDVPEDRLRVYRSSTRLRLTCVYAFRPQWRALANQHLGRLLARG